MIELYHGDCQAFLSDYDGPAFDAVGVELSAEIAESAAKRLGVAVKKVGDCK